MSEEEHHTIEQADKAFAYAPKILRELVKAGVQFPRFELFEDASGSLILGKAGEVTNKQWELASSLVYSRRSLFSDQIGITFCCGLVTASEKEG